MYYYLILILQGFCIYHAYTNRKAYYWYFLIIFLPFIGCLIYLITQVFSKRDVTKAQDEITQIINPGKKIKDLEKRLSFSDTFENRTALADAYFQSGNIEMAIKYYEKSLDGMFKNDFYTISKLIDAYFQSDNLEKADFYAQKILSHKEFNKSKTQFIYGLVLVQLNRFDDAEIHLKHINAPYSNYKERIVLADFYLKYNKKEEAKEIYQDILDEGSYMRKESKRKYAASITEAKQKLTALERQ